MQTISKTSDEAVAALRDYLTRRHEEALRIDLAALDRLIAIAGIPQGVYVYVCDNCGCIDPDVFDGSRCRTTACCWGRDCGWGKTTSYKIHELADMFTCIDHIRSRRKDLPADLPVVMTGARVPRPDETGCKEKS
jgi:hypothetical protein